MERLVTSTVEAPLVNTLWIYAVQRVERGDMVIVDALTNRLVCALNEGHVFRWSQLAPVFVSEMPGEAWLCAADDMNDGEPERGMRLPDWAIALEDEPGADERGLDAHDGIGNPYR